MVAEEAPCLVNQNSIFGLIQPPEVRMSLPRLEVDIPYGLSMGVFNAQACVPDLFFITHLTRVRVDIVQAKVSDWSPFVWRSIFRQVHRFPIVLPSHHLRAVAMM